MNIKIGIDEAGRGPWAGPVYAGVVILNADQEKLLHDAGVTDSKKLTEKKREKLFPLILENSVYTKVKYLPADQIDKVGIYKATIALIQMLVVEIDIRNFGFSNGELKVLVDGIFPELTFIDSNGKILNYECIVKGDEKEPSISAASILAKVKRDHYMSKLHERLPHYAFDKHKGYGTKLHREMLEKYGPCEEHRRSFAPIKKFIG